MLALLSPSKTLDFETPSKFEFNKSSPTLFASESLKLIDVLKNKTKQDISKLMSLSEKLAELNYKRYQRFAKTMTENNSKEAVLAFKGDVYEGLSAESFNKTQLKLANKKIAILSGLYGLIQPLELIQPYRLEMGTKLKNNNGEDLYQFWGDKITNEINKLEQNIVVNLASNEYFKAVKKNQLKAQLINIDFKEDKNNKISTIAIYAKKARGQFARFLIEENITEEKDLKKFKTSGYKFDKTLSEGNKLTFLRKHD